MASFKKTVNLGGKFKMLSVQDGSFFDSETGELVPVADYIADVFGDTPFDLTVSAKDDTEITPEVRGE